MKKIKDFLDEIHDGISFSDWYLMVDTYEMVSERKAEIIKNNSFSKILLWFFEVSFMILFPVFCFSVFPVVELYHENPFLYLFLSLLFFIVLLFFCFLLLGFYLWY